MQPLGGTGPAGQGRSPSIDSPANDRECEQELEQAARGHRPHRPAVLGGKGAGVHGGGRGRQWVVINGNEATCAGPGLSLATSLCSVQPSAVINSGQATPKPERCRAPQASPGKMAMDVGFFWSQRCLP